MRLRRSVFGRLGLVVGLVGLMSGFVVIGMSSVGDALPVTGSPFTTNVPSPVGVAATPTALYVSTYGSPTVTDCNVIWSVDKSGNATAYADLADATNGACETDEVYLAVAPGPFGSYPGGELFATDGPNVFAISPGGCGMSATCVTQVATLSDLPYVEGGPPDANGGSHTGLTFAGTTGPFANDLIAVGENGSNSGDVYTLTASGLVVTATLLTTISSATEGLEAPSILPASWGAYAGDIITVSDQANSVYFVKSDGTFTTMTDSTNLEGVEATAVVPSSPCNYGGSSYFASMYNETKNNPNPPPATLPNPTLEGWSPTTLSGLAGDVLVNTEGNSADAPPYLGVLALSPNSPTFTPPAKVATFDDSTDAAWQQEGGSMANCPLNTTGVSTSLSATGVTTSRTITVPSGTAVTDQATLSGESSGAGGTVQYTVYTDTSCNVPANVGSGAMVGNAGTANVVGGVAGASNAVTLTASGTTPTVYYWQAVYSGDVATGDAGSTSTCTAEQATVSPPQTGNGSSFTPGYYKNNHDNITCATLKADVSLPLGNYNVTDCMPDAIAILDETGCGHQDGLVKCTAEQLLVAELQTTKGAAYGGPSNPCIDAEIATVNGLLANDVGPSGGYNGPNGTYTITNNATAQFQAAQSILSAYNQDRNSSTC